MKKFILPAVIIGVIAVAAVILLLLTGGGDVYRLIKVESFEGTVTVQRDEKINVFNGLQLVSEDYVEVGGESLLLLLADSDKHIAAEADTAFRLHSTGTDKSGNITIDLMYGKSLFTIDNKLNESSSFVVKTSNATMSVRGTTFSVEYSATERKTVVEVSEGVVHVEYNGGEKDLLVGESIIIKDSDDEISAETETFAAVAEAKPYITDTEITEGTTVSGKVTTTTAAADVTTYNDSENTASIVVTAVNSTSVTTRNTDSTTTRPPTATSNVETTVRPPSDTSATTSQTAVTTAVQTSAESVTTVATVTESNATEDTQAPIGNYSEGGGNVYDGKGETPALTSTKDNSEEEAIDEALNGDGFVSIGDDSPVTTTAAATTTAASTTTAATTTQTVKNTDTVINNDASALDELFGLTE